MLRNKKNNKPTSNALKSITSNSQKCHCMITMGTKYVKTKFYIALFN